MLQVLKKLTLLNDYLWLNVSIVSKRMSSNCNNNCIFCKIIEGESPATKYYEDEDILIFEDIKPAAKVHALAIPKKHIPSINSLKKNDIPLINKLVEHGKKVVEEQGGDLNDLTLGFHTPPFNTVSHLHLHVLSPSSQMSLIHRIMFKPNPFFFSAVDNVIQKLQNKL